MKKILLAVAVIGGVAFGLFQNCSNQKLSTTQESQPTNTGNTVNGGINAGGTPNTGGGTTGGGTTGGGTTGGGTVDSTCGNQIKVGNTCVDFTCMSVVQLSAAQLLAVPARTADGICYAYKIMNALPVAPSGTGSTKDPQVVARDHDTGAGYANAWMMASFLGRFKLLGPRVVKLSGGPSSSGQILVDNFVVAGVYQDGTAPVITRDYQARGTADCATLFNGASTGNILFQNTAIPLRPFGSAGVSSITPIDITSRVPANVTQVLDVRADDCGVNREMSDVYLLFQ